MFRVTFAPPAARSWAALSRSVQRAFNEAFSRLEQDPRRVAADLDVHQLYGYQNVWTLRIPPYRGIYVIEGNEVVMIVFGHREVVYSLLHGMIPPGRRSVSKSSVERRR